MWILMFLFWELTGDLKWTPWKTFSETVWDVEKRHPGTKRRVLAFSLALSEHMLERTELKAAYAWALENVDSYEAWILAQGGGVGG